MFTPNEPVDELMMWAACYLIAMHAMIPRTSASPKLIDVTASEMADVAVKRIKAKGEEFDKLKATPSKGKGKGH